MYVQVCFVSICHHKKPFSLQGPLSIDIIQIKPVLVHNLIVTIFPANFALCSSIIEIQIEIHVNEASYNDGYQGNLCQPPIALEIND